MAYGIQHHCTSLPSAVGDGMGVPKTAGAKRSSFQSHERQQNRAAASTKHQAAAQACNLPTVLAVPAPYQSAPRRRQKSKERSPNHIIGLALTDPVLETTRDRSVW